MEDLTAHHRRKRILWIVGGVLSFIILIGLGIGSLSMGLVYNHLRPAPRSQAETQMPTPKRVEITLLANGTYLWNTEPVSGDSPEQKLESLKSKIQATQSTDLWNSNFFIIQGEQETPSRPILEMIQAIQAIGGAWETHII